MVFSATLLFLTLKFTLGYPDYSSWKLAININPEDGHNFGFFASAWDDENDVGNSTTAFSADYKSYDVALETANFIAIVRHQDGVCEAARVWEFLAVGKTLHEYMNIKKTLRLVATYGNYTSTYISSGMANKDKDPIFAVDGALVFNWLASNDGVRIGNSNSHCGKELPAGNSNKFFGLGNDLSLNTQTLVASTFDWSDAGTYDCSTGPYNRVQGTDHGTNPSDGVAYGQYAVYVSDLAETFPCEGRKLQTRMYDARYQPAFDRVEKDGDKVLSYIEFVFDKADFNKDGVISRNEYSGARLNHRFAKTGLEDALTDFYRVDRNGDEVLDIDEIEFDSSDINKDGELSYYEYYVARAAHALADTE